MTGRTNFFFPCADCGEDTDNTNGLCDECNAYYEDREEEISEAKYREWVEECYSPFEFVGDGYTGGDMGYYHAQYDE